MATFTRNNVWNNGGDFTNLDLLWYARGVGKMMSRSLDDKASWWFYAAMHGEYVSLEGQSVVNSPQFPDWSYITPAPAVPTSPLPSPGVRSLFWNQCQHQTWYFLPWHRGYLLALEAQLRQDILSLSGPSTWALPYWNYFGGANGIQYKLPPAFAQPRLPDGSANPLFVKMRYGPDGDSKIYIPTPAGEAANPGDPNFSPGEVTEQFMTNDLFTGSDLRTKSPGFGGPQTPFQHLGSTSGNLETDPHNYVHSYVGGALNETDYGLMSDPGIAALDPIFYLHHANIDRLWAIWNLYGNSNPTDPDWLNGPMTRQFVMPGPGGDPWYYTPTQMDNLNELNYTYQELPPTPPLAPSVLAQRLTLLGAKDAAAREVSGLPTVTTPRQTELLGASDGPLVVKGRTSQTTVKLDSSIRRKVIHSLVNASQTALPDNVYLKLENVRGTFDASVLGVYVNLPNDAKPRDSQKFLAGNVSLFGLRGASAKDGQHGGEGLTFLLNVTRVVDSLYLDKQLDVGALSVTIVPSRPLPDKADITVGRISLYRESY
jgi:tyrosinase